MDGQDFTREHYIDDVDVVSLSVQSAKVEDGEMPITLSRQRNDDPPGWTFDYAF
jgi:hypothetical protein